MSAAPATAAAAAAAASSSNSHLHSTAATKSPPSASTATTAPSSATSSASSTPSSSAASTPSALIAGIESLSIAEQNQPTGNGNGNEETAGSTTGETGGEEEKEGEKVKGGGGGGGGEESEVSESSSSSSTAAAHSAKSTDSIELRYLISSAYVGAIIGKEGSNIKRVRNESNAFITIIKNADSEYFQQQQMGRHQVIFDRVMMIRGTIEQIGIAVKMICDLLCMTNLQREQAATNAQAAAAADPSSSHHHHPHSSSSHIISQVMAMTAAGETSSTTSLRMLIHRAAVGAIIGKGGAVIKDTQTQSNARVQVATEPLVGSTEKIVTVSGTPTAISIAVKMIGLQLLNNPLRPGTRSYFYNPSLGSTIGGLFVGPPLPASSSPSTSSSASSSPSLSSPAAAAAAAGLATSAFYPPASIYPPQFGAPLTASQKIAIPTVCSGLVIGKGGRVIRDLRMKSGTTITIAEQDESNPLERIVTIVGTPAQIQAAVYLIRQLVESYTPSAAAAAAAASMSSSGHQQEETSQQ